jgi:hypothetical protein
MTKMENNSEHLISDFVKSLLTNMIQQMPAPPIKNMVSSQALISLANGTDITKIEVNDDSASMLSSVASGLWSVVTLGYGSSSEQPSPASVKSNQIETFLPDLPADVNSSNSGHVIGIDTQIDCSTRLLAWQSCHIMLILSNHCTHDSLYNPYRLAMFHFTHTQDTPTNLPNSEPLPWFSIDFTKLFQMFTFTLHNDQYTLLLYMLLHRNQHFKMFILSRLNIDLLVTKTQIKLLSNV